MSWNELETSVRNMGFEIAFRTRCDENGALVPDLTPPEGKGWRFVATYDNVAGLWVKASPKAPKRRGSSIDKMIAALDPFIGTVETPVLFDDRLPMAPPPWQISERRFANLPRRRSAQFSPANPVPAGGDRRSLRASDRRIRTDSSSGGGPRGSRRDVLRAP